MYEIWLINKRKISLGPTKNIESRKLKRIKYSTIQSFVIN